MLPAHYMIHPKQCRQSLFIKRHGLTFSSSNKTSTQIALTGSNCLVIPLAELMMRISNRQQGCSEYLLTTHRTTQNFKKVVFQPTSISRSCWHQ